jgi:hypothetical protein
MANKDDLPLGLRKQIEAVHRRMAENAATGGVRPNPTIANRRTGYVQHFGARRAFDMAYVCEVLAASGCIDRDIERLTKMLDWVGREVFGDDGLVTVDRVLSEATHLERIGPYGKDDIKLLVWCLRPLKENNCGDFDAIDLADSLPILFSEQFTPRHRELLKAAGPRATLSLKHGLAVLHCKKRDD